MTLTTPAASLVLSATVFLLIHGCFRTGERFSMEDDSKFLMDGYIYGDCREIAEVCQSKTRAQVPNQFFFLLTAISSRPETSI